MSSLQVITKVRFKVQNESEGGQKNRKLSILTKIFKVEGKTAPIGNISYYEAENMANPLLLSSVLAPGHHESEI